MLPFFPLFEKIKEKVRSLLFEMKDSKMKVVLIDSDSDESPVGTEMKTQRVEKGQEVGARVPIKDKEKGDSDNQVSRDGTFTSVNSNVLNRSLSKTGSVRKGIEIVRRFRDSRNHSALNSDHQLSSVEFNWTEDQLESLTTALAAFKYCPERTVERVYREMRDSRSRIGSGKFLKARIRCWLSRRCNHDSSKRMISRKRKIEELGEIEVSQKKRVKKIMFSEKVELKVYEISEQTAAVEDSVMIIDLKD